MDARELIITELRNYCHSDSCWSDFTWDDKTFLRTATIRIQRGDESAWAEFIQRMNRYSELAEAVLRVLVSWDYLYYDYDTDDLLMAELPEETSPLMPCDTETLISCLLRAPPAS